MAPVSSSENNTGNSKNQKNKKLKIFFIFEPLGASSVLAFRAISGQVERRKYKSFLGKSIFAKAPNGPKAQDNIRCQENVRIS